MLHINSKVAYATIQKEKTRAKDKVLETIKGQRATRQEIAEILGWPINRVTGRVSELLQDGVIEECATVYVDKRPRAVLRAR